jgi:hypothetical protein
MFPKLKPNGEVHLLADLVAKNKITVKDHGPIPNQAGILRTLARMIFFFLFNHACSLLWDKYNRVKL